MAKIGSAEYPELSVSDALEIIESVWRERITTVDGLAKHLGHTSAKSGAFYVKAAALNKFYGLVTQEKTEIGLTDRAKRILMGTSEAEKATARQEAALAPPMFRDLYSKLGTDYNKADFLPRLRDLSNASVEELHASAGYLQKLYDDAIRYAKTGAAAGRSAVPRPQPTGSSSLGSEGMLVVQVPGRPQIAVPWDPIFIDGVIAFLTKEKEAMTVNAAPILTTNSSDAGEPAGT